MGMFDKIKKAMGYADKYSSVSPEERQRMDAEAIAGITGGDLNKQMKIQAGHQEHKDMAEDLASQTGGVIDAGNFSKILNRIKPDMSQKDILKVIAEEQRKLTGYSAMDNIGDMNKLSSDLMKKEGVAKDATEMARKFVGKDVNVAKPPLGLDGAWGMYRPKYKDILLDKDANISTGFHEGSHLYDDILNNLGNVSNDYYHSIKMNPKEFNPEIAKRSKAIAKKMEVPGLERKLDAALDNLTITKDPDIISSDADKMISKHFSEVPTEYNMIKQILSGKPVIHKEPTEVASEFVKRGKVTQEAQDWLRKFLADKYDL